MARKKPRTDANGILVRVRVGVSKKLATIRLLKILKASRCSGNVVDRGGFGNWYFLGIACKNPLDEARVRSVARQQLRFPLELEE